MRVALLAGGLGSRLSEETDVRPKPMVEIGGKPILWHIMMHYYASGFDEFAIALGYKSEYIKRWAVDMATLEGDLRVSPKSGTVENFAPNAPDWTMDLVETGLSTNTGGRVRRLRHHVGQGTFFLAWGDGVYDVDLHKMAAFHRAHGKAATVMIVQPPARFGHVALDGGQITAFKEKPAKSEGWINGGVFCLEPRVFDYIADDDTAFEREPLENLARDGQLMAYRHEGFWQCMDTLQEKRLLEDIWQSGEAPWKTWRDRQCASWSPAIVATSERS
ncbi:MAG: glucose-1-phosphate cytidylyltransferase [Rhodobacteraceae bacterium]|nr:glucose-1-phosphate cytidylyltransferase [Paracoccaceae bacterium]